MNNPEKGHLIEMYVKTKLTELGYEMFYPVYAGSIVDLILKKGSNLYKVQIK
jgi:predicted AAA+ superfamily ATPase